MALAWTIKGIGKTYKLAAEGAATRAGLSLGQWLDGVILSHPAGPTRSDADAEITRALEALESRIEERGARLDEIIKPLHDQLERLEEESEALRHGHGKTESSATREIERHIARMDAMGKPGTPASPDDDILAPDPAAVRPRPPGHSPSLGDLQRHKLLRLAAGAGAMAMIIGSGSLGIWLWNAHENLPQAQSAPAALPGAIDQSQDQTPPPIIAAINAPVSPITAKTPAEINALRDRAQDPTRDPGHTAAFELGMALLKGKVGAASLREAGEWIANAALAGHAQAQLELGRLYAGGQGYARDPQQAFFWISSAAEQGITEAAYALGMLYTHGEGIERSHALAARWFRKAGEKQHAGALYQLGLIYELGLDYRANPGRALGWYRKAATAGSTAAAEKVRALEAKGTIVPAPRKSASKPVSVPAPAIPSVPAALGRAEIAELQRLLESLSLYPGPADGVPGAKTFDAIRLYQQMAGLKADGIPSRKLLDQIREVAGQSGAPR